MTDLATEWTFLYCKAVGYNGAKHSVSANTDYSKIDSLERAGPWPGNASLSSGARPIAPGSFHTCPCPGSQLSVSLPSGTAVLCFCSGLPHQCAGCGPQGQAQLSLFPTVQQGAKHSALPLQKLPDS